MATRILTTNGTYTTGTWREIEASTLGGSWTNDDLNTPRSKAVTFANAGNQVGIWLALSVASTASGTLTIKLQEYVGSTWTDRTTDTLSVNATNFPAQKLYKYVALTTYAVTNAAATWRYLLSCDVANRISWARSGTAGDYAYAVALDYSTATPTSGDTLILAEGITFTVDQSITGYVYISNGAIFSWPGTVAASYTFTGQFYAAHTGYIKIGTDTPIPAANRAIINCGANFLGTWAYSYSSTSNYTCDFGIEIYGAPDTHLATNVAAAAATLQKNVVTADDMSAIWSNGDTIIFYGKNYLGLPATDTIASMSGTTITFTNNLDYNLLAGGMLVNKTRAEANLGVKIHNASPAQDSPLIGVASNTALYGYLKLSGVWLSDLSLGNAGYYMWKSTTNVTADLLAYLYNTHTHTNQKGAIGLFSNYLTLTDVYIYNTANYEPCLVLSGNNITVTNVAHMKQGALNSSAFMFHLAGNNCTVSNVCLSNGYNTDARYLFRSAGASNTFTNVRAIAAKDNAYIATHMSTYTNCRFEAATQYQVKFDTAVGNTFFNCAIGAAASATYDIYIVTAALVQAILTNCTVGTATANNIAAAIAGSYLRWHTYNATANQHNCYHQYGNLVSTGDALLDTTAHTAGTGAYALRFQPLSSTNPLTWTFSVPTGNISGKTMTVAVWVKINNAAYWAATHQKPRLHVNYDNGTILYAEATASTAWQQLFVNITPSTAYGEITVTLSGRTDATTTNAYFYVDDVSLIFPANSSLDLGSLDYWANALPVVPPIAKPTSAYTLANAVWQSLTAGGWTAGTFGKLLLDYIDAAISSRLAAAAYTAPPTAAQNADAVLDEDATGHTGILAKVLTVARYLGLK